MTRRLGARRSRRPATAARPPLAVPAMLTALALVVASCGGGRQGGDGQPTRQDTQQGGTATPSPESATVAVAQSQYGTVLVDGAGRALYLFTPDEQDTSTCYGTCAQERPPLLTQQDPRAAGAAKPELLDTITRENGKTQVTYAGHPLYYYQPDQGLGNFTGQDLHGFGGQWYLVTPAGRPAKHDRGEGDGY